MNPSHGKSVWISVSEAKYYLLPDDLPLEDGELALISLSGRMQRVTPESVASHEISEAEARPLMQGQLMGFFTQAQTRLEALFSALTPPKQETPTAPDEATSVPGSVELTAAVLGVSPETVRGNPSLTQLGLHTLLTVAADVLEGSISEDEARFAEAQERVRAFRAGLQAQGVPTHERLEGIPEKVRGWYQGTANQTEFHQVVAALRTTAARLDPSRGGPPRTWEQVVVELGQALSGIFRQPEESPEARQETYRRDARRAIEEVMGPTRTFDFKKAWAEYNKDKEQAGE